MEATETTMKRSPRAARAVFLILSMLLIAASIAPAEDGREVDAVTAPTWTVELTGHRNHELQTYEVRDMVNDQGLGRTITVEERGELVEYSGVPLSAILGVIDSPEFEEPWELNRALWHDGYDVTLTARDGYAATFNTADFATDELLFAVARDGEAIYPQTSGEVALALWVKNIVSVETSLGRSTADAARAAFDLLLTINGREHRYSLTDLEQLSFFLEGPGQYTTSAGVVHGGVYGGVLLKEMLEQFLQLEAETSITFVAVDGYEMTYSGEQVLDQADGRWLLAFERDGEPLPADPGYIRTIKVGPDTPDIDGHVSVRMIAEIVVDGEEYRDFSLRMLGPMNNDLDRSTLQSTMAFTEQTVVFTHRGETNEYTGIPLYELLAFSDDPRYAPHRQDSTIDPYNREAAAAGYNVIITASDGFAITLDSRDLHENDDVILALKKNGEELPESEWPLIVVWDEDAAPIPEGIKNVRNVVSIELEM